MTEVGHADLSRLLQSKRNECNAIVTSRKRKLRELFAVATQADGLPQDAFANPDAPAATPAEWQFLQASDILQGKPLNDSNIPARPRLSLETLRLSLAKSVQTVASFVPAPPTPNIAKQVPLVAKAVVQSPDARTSVKAGATPSKAHNLATAISKKAPSIPNLPPTPFPASLIPQQPVDQIAKPASKVESVPCLPAQGIRKQSNEATNGGDENPDHAAPRRPVQVSFPPGTKGSPSTNVTPGKSSDSDSNGATQSCQDRNGSINRQPSRAEDGKPLTIKSPLDTPKTHDALSSPGSTVPSAAATPAVHDVSTDTSPEHDGPRSPEEAQELKVASDKNVRNGEQKEHKDAAADSSELGGAKQTNGAVPIPDGDQLLQEAIRSSAAVDMAVNIPVDAPVTSRASTVDAVTSSAREAPQVDKDNVPAQPAVKEKTRPTTTPPVTEVAGEVPDSQGESPEAMDVDATETRLVIKTNKDESPNTPTQVRSISPPPPKSPPKIVPQAPERAVTRVSSGAMRLKSVTEIVGGLRPSNSTDKPNTKTPQHQLTPVTATPQSPPSKTKYVPMRKEKPKGQVSTVLFGKQPKRVDDNSLVSGQRDTLQPSDDYYTPLFIQNFTGATNWMQPIEKILFHANKTIATPDAYLAIQDHQACKVLRRVYHLQQHDKWSLRQPKRCPEPTRPPSQWDVLFQEMKWMRTDFREERKWKMATARNLARACADWYHASPEERKMYQVPAFIPPKTSLINDVAMADADEDNVENHPTPGLVPGDVESPQPMDELLEEFPETVAPSAIFALQEEDVVFGLRRTPASDKLLDELPLYGSPLKIPRFDLTGPEYDPDCQWRRPALPLSKYVEGQMKLISEGPPRKRSRFSYKNEDSEDEKDNGFDGGAPLDHVRLPPPSDEVALFTPESKHIRDRLHAGHQFRPPSEHPMPTQNFYECRSPSQWTMVEDDELRGLVREHSYNWSLISNMLTTKSLFNSGAERRTPWECFERWINLEGLPSDMQKTQYFKAYNSRIEAAQRVIAQQNQLAAQQASASGGAVTPVRRRQSTPLRVDRRRNQKHLTLIDAMRKLAKKRETTIQKQQHNATQNAAKKTNDTISQRPTKTPRDYSLLRWERDQALAEKMAQYAQRQEAQRRAAFQARLQGQNAHMAGTPAAAQVGQNGNQTGTNGINGVARPGIPNQLAVAAAAAAAAAAAQGRPRVPMQAPANGVGAAGVQSQMGGNLAPPAQMNGTPQAQMQAMQAMQGLQGQQHRVAMPNQQPDASLMMRAQRISEQQRAAAQIQQAQQQQNGAGTPGSQGQQNSPAMRNGVNSITQQSFLNNAQAMMAQFNANGGHASPPASGLHMPTLPNGTPPGPRMPTQIPPGIAAQLSQLETQFRAKNPNLTPEQARQLATEHLTRAMMAQRQSAMNAAAGAGQSGIATSIAATTSPHQYAALLRQQQQQQQQQQKQQQQHQQQKPHPQQHPQQHQQKQPLHQPKPQQYQQPQQSQPQPLPQQKPSQPQPMPQTQHQPTPTQQTPMQQTPAQPTPKQPTPKQPTPKQPVPKQQPSTQQKQIQTQPQPQQLQQQQQPQPQSQPQSQPQPQPQLQQQKQLQPQTQAQPQPLAQPQPPPQVSTASASPAGQVQQRQASGSATPSASK